jgi:hypothetical protein
MSPGKLNVCACGLSKREHRGNRSFRKKKGRLLLLLLDDVCAGGVVVVVVKRRAV